jgi:hypothetical protein
LAWTVTGGNRHDVTQLIPLLDKVPPVRGKKGRPRRRPERLTADRGYDYPKYRRRLRQRGIRPEIARANRPSTAPGLAVTAGSSSAPSPGSTNSNGYSSATTAATTSTKRSSPSPAASSAIDDWRTHSDSSSKSRESCLNRFFRSLPPHAVSVWRRPPLVCSIVLASRLRRRRRPRAAALQRLTYAVPATPMRWPSGSVK